MTFVRRMDSLRVSWRSNSLTVAGSAFSDTLIGDNGVNVITGGAGNDSIDGRAGVDVMTGGTGNDVYYVYDSGDVIVEADGEGARDRVLSKADYTLAAGVSVEILGAVNQLQTTALNLTGNEFGQRISGNAGDNVLDGAGGDDDLTGIIGHDTLIGGTGNDVYRVDTDDVIVETAGEGSDLVRAYTSYTLAAGVSIETMSTKNSANTTAIDLTGNELNQKMIANEGVNVLDGGGGNDRIQGLGGNDTLIGGDGADQLTGGTGNDIFRFNDASESTGAARDIILDFASGDSIDLANIDANSGAADDQAFTFIGTDAFSNIAGELRYSIIDGNTLVYGDTDGDGNADLVIQLAGSHVMGGTDFGL